MLSFVPYLKLEAGSARALPWTSIGDGEMFEPATSNVPSTPKSTPLGFKSDPHNQKTPDQLTDTS